jgi:hypothetical protein
VLFLFFAVALIQNPNGIQRQIFYYGEKDLFADFFNIMSYITERDPYFNSNNVNGYRGSYLPLTFLILYPFSKLDNYSEMTLQDAWNSKIALMSSFFFTGFSIFLFILSLSMICKKFKVSSYILISLVLSYIFFFSIERGNTIILSAAFIGFFICYYDSQNRNKRILGAISLALAAVLKVYPVLFGFLYLEKKQYREIFLSASIALLLAFLPFLFFKKGFANIQQLVVNLRGLDTHYNAYFIVERFSLPHLCAFILNMLRFPERIIILYTGIAQIVTYFLCSISIIFSILIKNKWVKLSLLTMLFLFIPSVSILYCGLYMFPMIILYFSTLNERSKIFNIFIFIVFIVFLNPYQVDLRGIGISFDYIYLVNWRGIEISFNYVFINAVLLVFWLVLLIYSGRRIVASKIILTIKTSVTNMINNNKSSLASK